MDNLGILRKKLSLLHNNELNDGVHCIFNHLIQAEKHFINGLEDKNVDLFNDVIYRTNQAYEGILRLAYKIILKKQDKNKSNQEIEETLLKEKIINQRTKDYISLYRGDFRNCSIHDYQLVFTESDAFMAITNVTGFLYTLLNQLIVYDGFMTMQTKEKEIETISKSLNKHNLSERELLKEALIHFPKVYFSNPNGNDVENGFYAIGELEAYLNKINPKWKISICKTFGDEEENIEDIDEIYMLDMLIQTKTENIMLDICMDKDFRFRYNFISNMHIIGTMLNANYGIIFQLVGEYEYISTKEEEDIFLIDRIHPKEVEGEFIV